MALELLWIMPVLVIIAVLLVIVRAVSGGESKQIPGLIIGATVAIITVAVLLVPAINEYENETGISYDDYFETTAINANGAIELVTIDEVTYAHAKDLGVGTLTYSDGLEDSYNVHKAKLDVFMIGGQSNAAYRPASLDLATATPIPKIGTAYYYGNSDGAVAKPYDETSTATDYQFMDAVASDGTLMLAHLEAPFSATYYDNTGHKVYMINCAWGGSGIGGWVPGGYYFTWAKDVFAAAMAAVDKDHFDVDVKSCLWIQGESDWNKTEEYYEIEFMNWFNSIIGESALNFSKDYTFESIMISKVRVIDYDGTASIINPINPALAQIELANTHKNIIMVTEIADTFTVSNGLMLEDNLHYTQLGQNLIGVAFGDYFKKV